MAEERKSLKDLSVIGGALCLDFINTVDWRGREESYDYLADYQGLLDWWVFMGLVDPDEAAGLAARRADEADRTVRGALELREALYRVFLALSRGGRAPGADLERVNLRLPGSLSGAAMESGPEGIRARYQDRDQSLDWPLKPVLRSALEVLTSVPPERIKTCRNEECGWLFWDKSKNRSRCWCDMADCGNRAKAGRFYRKKKTTG